MAIVDDSVLLDSGASWLDRERVLERFEADWGAGRRPSIEEFLAAQADKAELLLPELVHIELECRLRAGEAVEVADYLRRFPGLASDDDAVRELLQASERRFLARVGPSLAPATDETLAPRLGPYALLEVAGQGTFGVVYKARDVRLDRTVAVKVPRHDLWSGPEAEARFFREARAAASLRHPGLVAVYEAGRIDGTIALVSDFIDGPSLAQQLEQVRPGPRQAALLIAQVAEAVGAAHHAGVVHRDLKPANILIDPEGRPWVTDFGLARRVADDDTLTTDGQLLGTPAYMAPEQARGEVHAADARTDVYSLGVVLYELLTGAPPFRGVGRALLEQVIHEEPKPPRRFDDRISRDLETVCLKAMAKEPAGRYVHASELADDLGRFLRSEPVRARPLGAAATLWRRCRRRPARTALVCSLAATLLIALVGITWQWRRAEMFRRSAEARSADAEWQRQRDLLHMAKALNLFRLIQAGQTQLVRASSAPPDATLVRDQLAEYYRIFSQELPGDRSSLGALAEASTLFAQLVQQTEPAERAIAAWRQAQKHCTNLAHSAPKEPDSRMLLAWCDASLGKLLVQQEKTAEGRELLGRSRDSWRQVVAHLRHDLEPRAGDDRALFKIVEAETNLGAVEYDLGETKGAIAILDRCRTFWVERAQREPADPGHRHRLAICCSTLAAWQHAASLPAQAFQDAHRARTVFEDLTREYPLEPMYRLEWAYSLCLSATLEQEQGRPGEALSFRKAAAELFGEFARANPLVINYRRDQAFSLRAIAASQRDRGDLNAALSAYQQCEQVCEVLRETLPNDDAILRDLAETVLDKSAVESALDHASHAIVSLSQARDLYETLCRNAPSDPSLRAQLTTCITSLASAQRSIGQRAELTATLRRACDFWTECIRLHQDNPRHRKELCEYWCAIANLERAAEAPDRAIAALRRARELAFDLVRQGHVETLAQERLARMCYDLAEMLRASGQRAEALRAVGQAQELWESIASDHPASLDDQAQLAVCLFLGGALNSDVGRPAEALRRFRRSVAIIKCAARARPNVVDYQCHLATCFHSIGNVLIEVGQPADAVDSYRQALALREQLCRATPADALQQSNYGGTWNRLGEALEQLGRGAEAAEAYRQAIVHQEIACARDPGSAKFRSYLDGHRRHLSQLEGGLNHAPNARGDAGSRGESLGPAPSIPTTGLSPASQRHSGLRNRGSTQLPEPT